MMAITRFTGLLGIGQSYFHEGYTEHAYFGFMSAIKVAVDASAATIASNTGLSVSAGDLMRVRNLCTDGSAILQANAGADGYWVTDALASGPLLTAATATISGYSQKPLVTVHSHGQQDVGGIASQADAADVATAISTVLWPGIRSAINAGSPSTQPIWVDMIGPRYAVDEMAEYWLRDEIIDLIDATSRVYRGTETYHLPLDMTTHPNEHGYKVMGAHTGRKVAAWLVNTSGDLRGPQINTATIVGNTVEVDFTVPVGKTMLKPTTPDFFGLFTSGDARVPVTSYAWDGDTLVLGFTGSPTKLRYPARSDRTLDIENIVRLDISDPMFTGEPGPVLESVKTMAI